jgi:dethiobiotin synthetase
VRGLFVTGTDTGAGKTALTAALVAAIAAAGEPVRAYKPVVTGLDERPDGGSGWPHDHEVLAAVARMSPEEVAPRRYGPAASPHLAAALVGANLDGEALLGEAQAAAVRAADAGASLIVEGVGGLLVPLAAEYTVRDLARDLALPLLIAARPGLGTINHTLLTLQAARAGQLQVRAVVLTPWPGRPGEIECSNRETIARLGEVDVQTLRSVAEPDPGELARAGDELPWRSWLE